MLGVLIGNVACGQIADLIGRKHPLFVAVLALVVLNLVAAFSTSWIMFAVIRFLIGLAMGFELTVHYNVAAEYTLARWRAWVVAVPSWAIASALFAGASWALKDWQHLHFVTAVIGIPALATYWYVKLESQYRPTRKVFVYKIQVNPIHTILKYGDYCDFMDK